MGVRGTKASNKAKNNVLKLCAVQQQNFRIRNSGFQNFELGCEKSSHDFQKSGNGYGESENCSKSCCKILLSFHHGFRPATEAKRQHTSPLLAPGFARMTSTSHKWNPD